MITAAEFKQRWNDSGSDVHYNLRPFLASALENVRVAEGTKQFLIQAGLPFSAAPFLNFGAASFEQKVNDEVPDLASAWEVNERYKIYREIGGIGSGSPICLEEPSGRIVCVDHEYRFQIIFVNSSIFQLAETLLLYRSYVKRGRKMAGSQAWFKTKIPEEVSRWYNDQLRHIDRQIFIEPNSFWPESE